MHWECEENYEGTRECYLGRKERWTTRELADSISEHETKHALLSDEHQHSRVLHIDSSRHIHREENADALAYLAAVAGTLESTTITLYVSSDVRYDLATAEIIASLQPRSVYLRNRDCLLVVIGASASSDIFVADGIPTAYFEYMRAPKHLQIRGDGNFFSCTHFQRLLRSGLTSLSIGERVLSAEVLNCILEFCKSSDCLLTDVDAYFDDGISSKLVARVLCDIPHYINVIRMVKSRNYRYSSADDDDYDGDYNRGSHVLLSEEAWEEAQKTKAGIRVLFSAAALSNAPHSPYVHRFLNACGRDVKREIAGYLL